MKTLVEYSDYTEYQRILFICRCVKSGFYKSKNFFLLPYLLRNPRAIFLPKLDIFGDKDFFSDLSINAQDVYTTPFSQRSKYYQHKIISELKQNNLIYDNEVIKDIPSIKLWENVSLEFFTLCDKIFPGLFEGYTKVIIRPTKFGSICSQFSSTSNSESICIYIREDADLNNIIEAILMVPLNLTGKKRILENLTWEEREVIIDFLINNSILGHINKRSEGISIKKLKDNKKRTIPILRDNSYIKIIEESNKYFETLGFSNDYKITISARKITINNVDIPFSRSEDKVFRLLFRNRNDIVSLEEIGKTLWLDNISKKFSLFAITKLIQRMRAKIEKNGVNSSFIGTQRNRGFIMKYSK